MLLNSNIPYYFPGVYILSLHWSLLYQQTQFNVALTLFLRNYVEIALKLRRQTSYVCWYIGQRVIADHITVTVVSFGPAFSVDSQNWKPCARSIVVEAAAIKPTHVM